MVEFGKIKFGDVELVLQQVLPDPYQEALKDLLPETGGPAVCVGIFPVRSGDSTQERLPEQPVSSRQPQNLFRTAEQFPLF